MTKTFILGTKTVEDVTFINLRGVIDEDNRLASSLRKIDGATVIIDLSQIKRINSCGVRDWVNWLNDLDSRGKRIILVKCSPCIVNQLNLVNNFVGRGQVKSFFAPYYCEKCDQEALKLLQTEAFAGQAKASAPEMRCPHCANGTLMEFDDLEASYFSFLPRNSGAVADSELDTVIESLSSSVQDRIRRLDRVEELETQGTPTSGSYSPLTATSHSLAHDPLSLPGPTPIEGTPPNQGKGPLAMGLTALAVVLIGSLIGYVFIILGDR